MQHYIYSRTDLHPLSVAPSPRGHSMCVDNVVREAKRDFVSVVKLSTPWRFGVLLFAGDMVLMADSAKGLESNLKVMNQLLSRWEGKENRMKTRLMRVARQKGHC